MSTVIHAMPHPVPRHRSDTKYRVNGGYITTIDHRYTPKGTVFPGSAYQFRRRTTDDYIGKGRRFDGTIPPSNFNSVFESMGYGHASGETQGKLVSGYHASHGYAPTEPRNGWGDDDKSDAEYATQLLAMTSPFRTTVSIPEMVSDFVGGVTLLKLTLGSVVTLPARAQITSSFVINPLVQDIRTLNNIVGHLNSRIREFQSLTKKGGLRRRVRLDSFSAEPYVSEEETTFSVFGNVTRGHTTETHHRKVWGSVRWRPRCDIPVDLFDSKNLWNLALRQILDLEKPDLATIWEIIPFSWAIDYFTNLGEIFQSLEGREFVEPYDVCIMRETTGTRSRTYIPSSGVDLSISEGSMSRTVVKNRSVIFEEPDLDALSLTRWPSDGQLSNLLAVLALIIQGRFSYL